MTLTLRRKLGISFAVLIIVTVAVLGTISYNKARDIVLNEIRFNNEQAVRNVNDYYLRSFMNDMEYTVTAWSRLPGVVNYRHDKGLSKLVRSVPRSFAPVTDAWAGYLVGNPDIAWIYLGVEENGSLLLSPLDPTMPLDYDCRTRDWYKETVEKDSVYWTQPYLDAGESGEIIVTVSHAVRQDDRLVGVVGMDIKLRKFSELIHGISAGEDGYLMLLGENGDVYAHPDVTLLTHNLSNLDWVQSILQNEQGTDFFTDQNAQYIYSYLTVPATGWKLVSVRPVNLPEAFGAIRAWTLDAAILAVMFLLIAGIFLGHVLLKPLNRMVGTINRVAGGDMDSRMPVDTQDEFGVLGDAFNFMLDRIGTLVREREQNVEALTEALGDIRTGYLTTVRALANAIEANDTYTRGHCDRVRYYAMLLGQALSMTDDDLNDLEFASMLHDVGKIGIPQSILNKPGALTEEELAAIRRHPEIGAEIIADIPFLSECQTILKQHHERIDGKGYPDGLSGDAIHQAAKILSIVDAFDAMTGTRPYRPQPMTLEEALRELQLHRGTQFDAMLVDRFVDVVRLEIAVGLES